MVIFVNRAKTETETGLSRIRGENSMNKSHETRSETLNICQLITELFGNTFA